MNGYVATIYRTTAMCGMRGDVMPSAAKAIRSAEIKAGRLFILGLCATQHDNFGPDKTQFMEEAAQLAIAQMRLRKCRVERFTVTDGGRDCSLEVARV